MLACLAVCLTACVPAPSGVASPTSVRIASLAGPTTMGLVWLMNQNNPEFDFTVAGTPDTVSTQLAAGRVDVGLMPVNLASVLYNKTDGAVRLAAVNTLGVLYIVSGDPAVRTLDDLPGHTVVSTGRGTTPQLVLDEVLRGAGINVAVDYRSQPTEVASRLAMTPSTVAVLPEPYVSAALAGDKAVHIVADLGDLWQKTTGTPLVSGAVVVRTDFLAQHPDAWQSFAYNYSESVMHVNQSPNEVAPLIVAQGLAPNVAVAEQAIPRCRIVNLTGDDAKTAVEAYLRVLFAADPAAVGNVMPDDSFYAV